MLCYKNYFFFNKLPTNTMPNIYKKIVKTKS